MKKTRVLREAGLSAGPVSRAPKGRILEEAAKCASMLPAGTTFAASEVGILGASAPQVSVLDLAGPNDAQLALHPSDVAYILSPRPDIIWLPHSDYTKLYGSLASAPQLRQDYDLYAGALDFGLAIRKQSRTNAQFAAAVDNGWQSIYLGYRCKMSKSNGSTGTSTASCTLLLRISRN